MTGRDEVGADDNRELTPIGENDGPLQRNDSTFGEYMATLERRSSSSLNRKLTSPGMIVHPQLPRLLPSSVQNICREDIWSSILSRRLTSPGMTTHPHLPLMLPSIIRHICRGVMWSSSQNMITRPMYGCATSTKHLQQGVGLSFAGKVSNLAVLSLPDVCHAGNTSNTERLLQRLHGSDGWEKLVSELQQKEEEEAKVQQPEVQERPQATSRKRQRQADNVAEKSSDRYNSTVVMGDYLQK